MSRIKYFDQVSQQWKYADEAKRFKKARGFAGAVTSVFGRDGDVVAEAGDYTADMVGARADTWMPTAADVAAVPAAEKGAASGVATLDTGGKIPVAQLPDAGKFTVLLPLEGWSAMAPFTQTVTVSDMTASGTAIYGLAEYSESAAKDYELITDVETLDGSVTVTCAKKKPAAALSIRIEVLR